MADLIFNPLTFPYQRVRTYVDGGMAVTSDEFYNPVQDVIALAYGGLTGLSCSIQNEDFDLNYPPTTIATSPFGQQMLVTTNSAFTVAPVTVGLTEGDHGVWGVLQTAAANGTFVASEAQCYVGNAQFILATKVQVTRLAGLDTVANGGFVIGFDSSVATAPHFRAGSDQPNWQAYVSTPQDTGVAIADATWYWLIIERRAGVCRWYICTPGNTPVKVYEVAMGALADCYRFVKCKTTGGAIGDGFWIDSIARAIER